MRKSREYPLNDEGQSKEARMTQSKINCHHAQFLVRIWDLGFFGQFGSELVIATQCGWEPS